MTVSFSYNAHFVFLYKLSLKHLSFQEECFLVKYQLFLSDFNETFSRQIFRKKYSNIGFDGNPSSGSQIISCRQTDGQTETKI